MREISKRSNISGSESSYGILKVDNRGMGKDEIELRNKRLRTRNFIFLSLTTLLLLSSLLILRKHVVIIDQQWSFTAASDKGNSNDTYCWIYEHCQRTAFRL